MKLFRRSSAAGATDGAATRTAPTQPIETGTVTWLRSLDHAVGQANTTGAPIFALFQEVPGCAGCQQFGADVLSNPMVVDAIENEFVPLLIHNNSPGPDAEVLAAYSEPAWNFQVVRFLDEAGGDIIERRDRVWETGPLAARMIQALQAHHRPVPTYLRFVEQEHSQRLRTAYLAQPCFWVGEAELGQIDGVVVTTAGFMHGHEVTQIDFDPLATTLPAIVDQAASRGVATAVFADEAGLTELRTAGSSVAGASLTPFTIAPDSDQKRQLQRRSVASGLTAGQLTKLNAWRASDAARADSYLSPQQRY